MRESGEFNTPLEKRNWGRTKSRFTTLGSKKSSQHEPRGIGEKRGVNPTPGPCWPRTKTAVETEAHLPSDPISGKLLQKPGVAQEHVMTREGQARDLGVRQIETTVLQADRMGGFLKTRRNGGGRKGPKGERTVQNLLGARGPDKKTGRVILSQTNQKKKNECQPEAKETGKNKAIDGTRRTGHGEQPGESSDQKEHEKAPAEKKRLKTQGKNKYHFMQKTIATTCDHAQKRRRGGRSKTRPRYGGTDRETKGELTKEGGSEKVWSRTTNQGREFRQPELRGGGPGKSSLKFGKQ